MISKSFNSQSLPADPSFKRHNKSMHAPLPVYKNLSTTQTAEDEEDDEVNESFQSQDDGNLGDTAQGTSSTARDVLLLKCRDAIESLHCEIEEERSEKQMIQEELI